MSTQNATLKQKAAHELQRMVIISLYLAFFFCAMATYRMVLLSDFRDDWFNYSGRRDQCSCDCESYSYRRVRPPREAK